MAFVDLNQTLPFKKLNRDEQDGYSGLAGREKGTGDNITTITAGDQVLYIG